MFFFFVCFQRKDRGGGVGAEGTGGGRGVFGLLIELRSGIITRKGKGKGWNKIQEFLSGVWYVGFHLISMTSMLSNGTQKRSINPNERFFLL